MKVHHAVEAPSDGPLAVAIGFFDGFHRGHREIVRTLRRGCPPGVRTAVLTFRNHPSTFLRPETTPPLISTLGERVNAIAAAGIDELYLLPFDERIATMTPQAFIDDVLVGTLQARIVVVGANFRFGAKRTGDVSVARTALAAHGVGFVAVENCVDDTGERISSTRIRAAIAAGDLATADALLGAPYEIRGVVELGAGRGHDLRFPTANMAVPGDKMLPRDGVFTMTARRDGRDYRGLVSIGTNPTFDGRTRTVEAWMLDFHDSIYGEELALREMRFLREQLRFDSVEALLAQMRADAAAVPYPSFR